VTAAPTIDVTVPHLARIWNYWLCDKDNFAVDRDAGDQYVRFFPGIVDIARADRAFLGRAARYLVAEAGIRQLLDIGTGLPTADNAHQVAQRIAPDARIVYVDNDPLVLAHARALLTSSPHGATRSWASHRRRAGRGGRRDGPREPAHRRAGRVGRRGDAPVDRAGHHEDSRGDAGHERLRTTGTAHCSRPPAPSAPTASSPSRSCSGTATATTART
jgi:hypothetical protein